MTTHAERPPSWEETSHTNRWLANQELWQCSCGAGGLNDASTPVDYGVFGGTIPYGHDSDCRYVPRALPPADVPDSVDRLLALGAPASVLYDFTLERFLRDRGIDPVPEYPPGLGADDRNWYAQLVMCLLALPFSDEPEWHERWRP